jgi:CheY-like chemotaxis protein
MGGSIDVVSEVGKGSEFQVTLHDVPYTTLYPADSDIPGKVLPQRSSADASRGQAAPKSAQRSYQHLRVLIADDVPMNLQVLSAMLKKMGIMAMTAANGRDVLHLLSNGQVPDVLLTDMWMPDMNGSQLADRIREQDRFRAMRIVAVTADAEVRSSFDMKHFDNILLKPITFNKLEELFSSL